MSRGRGRGNGLSLTNEQLQAMEISRGDTTAPTLAPPPLFPKLETKPLPLPSDSATDYMLIVKDQFIEYLHESPAYVKLRAKNDNIERYSDKYKLLALDSKKSGTLQCVWSNVPAELRPHSRREPVVRKRKIDDTTDIVERLQTLEKKEMDDVKKPQNVMKKEQDSDNEELEEEQEVDEVDEGTDYANNYFDNGEDYDDEDDNLDDDPVY